MRILLDAQLPPRLAKFISEWGNPASHAYDHLPAEAADRDIARFANSLPAALMSKDSDFVDLVDRNILRTTLIWVRSGNVDTDRLWATIHPNLSRIAAAIEAGERIIEIR
jgi:predicted nuclease of predicted toxin-antitoxin system